MNIGEVMPWLLLVLFSLAVSTGGAMVIFVMRLLNHKRREPQSLVYPDAVYSSAAAFLRRPSCWLAIKSKQLVAVQSALGLHNPKPCSWSDGLEQKLFIAPAINGWVLVMGSGLPDPSDDVDACYRFVVELSRKLGQIQFFSASRILHHHAWIRADGGKVVRAYAWAGRTLWQQGHRTAAETELDLKCFDYTESLEHETFGQPDVFAANVEKVPLLAERWSLDPARIDGALLEQEHGIAGEPSRRY
jgi:hypothetical protein